MPAVWEKSGKLYVTLWKRVAREFCDACGMVIKDDYFYKWALSYAGSANEWITLNADSHTNPTCSGFAVNSLVQEVPTADRLLVEQVFCKQEREVI